MKIVNRYLVELPVWSDHEGYKKIFEVVELANGNFYRLDKGSSEYLYTKVDSETMYEAIANSKL